MAEGEGVRRLIDDLSGEALKDFLRNLRHHSEVQRRIVAGELSREAVNAAYVRYARDHANEYRRQVTELTSDYYRRLARLSSEYSERFYSDVLNGALVAEGPVWTRSDVEPQRVPIELHGLLGKEIVGRFTLENSDPDPAGVTLEPGWCRGPDGEPFTAPLSVQPASIVVPPGGSTVITLRLALLASLFEPGSIYQLPVRVQGPRPMQLDVVIWAEDESMSTPGGSPPEAGGTGAVEAKTDAAAKVAYRVECPACGRVFDRSNPDDLRLRPHKRPDGKPCKERAGRRPS